MPATEQGFDGTVAWSNSPRTGPVILPRIPPHFSKTGSYFGPFNEAAAEGAHVGRRRVADTTYDVIRSTDRGATITSYFDTKTGLLARTEVDTVPRMVMTFEDYRRFDGFLVATRIVTRMGDMGEMVQRILSVDHKPIDPKLFAPPVNGVKQPD